MGVAGTPLFIDPDPEVIQEMELCVIKIRVWNRVGVVSSAAMLGWSIVLVINLIADNITTGYGVAQIVVLVVYFTIIIIAKSKLKYYNARALVAAKNLLKPIDSDVIDVESREVES